MSYTTTVKMGSRFHILRYWTQRREGRPKAIVESKKRNRQGKYRAACTTVYGVRVSTALWNDSSLLGAVAADLGVAGTLTLLADSSAAIGICRRSGIGRVRHTR